MTDMDGQADRRETDPEASKTGKISGVVAAKLKAVRTWMTRALCDGQAGLRQVRSASVSLCPQAPGQVHPAAHPPLRHPLHRLRLLPGGRHGDPAVL